MRWMVVALGALAGCSGGDAGVPQNVTVVEPGPARTGATEDPTRGWVGRWAGVEGMTLDIAPTAAPGPDRRDPPPPRGVAAVG